MRRFHLERDTDVSGVSGTGVVAHGVLFDNGRVALSWLGQWSTVTVHPQGMGSVEAVHGHGGATRIVWIDDVGATFGAPAVTDTGDGVSITAEITGTETFDELFITVWSFEQAGIAHKLGRLENVTTPVTLEGEISGLPAGSYAAYVNNGPHTTFEVDAETVLGPVTATVDGYRVILTATITGYEHFGEINISVWNVDTDTWAASPVRHIDVTLDGPLELHSTHNLTPGRYKAYINITHDNWATREMGPETAFTITALA